MASKIIIAAGVSIIKLKYGCYFSTRQDITGGI
jgi:hypothetical protein